MILKTPQDKTLAIIMGGGAGTRLFPLTQERAKPAVPLGGKYRLVDIPISNCLNGDFSQIYVLTQFNSTSLHRHINASYKFDQFSKSFVEILAAQHTVPGGCELVPGHSRRRTPESSRLLEPSLRTFSHPERRPALPDGLPTPAAGAPAHRGRHHPGHHTRRQTGGFWFWHHAQRCRSAHLPVRGKTQGSGAPG